MTAEDLKKSILQQAIQGKLVPQNPDYEPASALLERIRAEKAQLVADGKIKRDKNESVIYRNADGQYIERIGKIEKDISEEIPFEIPENWEWVRMGQIGDWGAGATPAKAEPKYYGGDILWLRTGELNNATVYDTEIKITNEALKECSLRLNQIGDILIAMYGATIGKLAIVGTPLTTNQACCACTPILIYNLYLFYFLMASKTEFIKKGEGGAQPNISREKLINYLMPLPPLAEQVRIVAKIEELMPMVEEYGKAQSRLDELNSALGDNLRKSVLQYAIQGKLVPQNPDDEPAPALLDRIRAEKTRLVADGKIKRVKNESVIYRNDDGQYIERIGKTETDITDQIPFEIPDSWEWVRLENITYPVGNKNNQILSKEILKEGSIPVVSQGQNLIDGYCENIEKRIDDIPLVMFGDHTRNVKYIDFPFVIGADGTKFHKCIIVNSMFLFYWMIITADQLRDRGYARHYSLLKQCFIPLPPLEEQKRIVERINQILKLY